MTNAQKLTFKSENYYNTHYMKTANIYLFIVVTSRSRILTEVI